jgi:hypothetical protein
MNSYSLHENGYVMLKNVLTPYQLQFGLNSDKNGIVNYKQMKDFIDYEFMPTIIDHTNFMQNPTYIKFRYSNNNNSTDASTFHSDIYNYTESELMPIYTCLCYFDKTQLEVIPGSHKKDFYKNNSSITSYNKKKILTIEPGDILVFHANMYHRGTNFDTKGDRRLLQVFEVFPDDKTYAQYSNDFLTVVTANTFTIGIINKLSYYLAKIPSLIDTINFLHYTLVFHDLQYKIIFNDIAPWEKKNKLVTYEPGKRLDYTQITGKDAINTNIICEKTNTCKPSNFYLGLYILYWIVFLLVIYLWKKSKK